MSSPVCNTAASVGLSSFPKLKTLSTKCTLIDFSFFSSAERHPVIFQLLIPNTSIRNCCAAQYKGVILRSPWKLACIIFNYSWHQIPWVSPLSPQLGLAQSCSVWRPGHPASPTLSLCHRNATSSYHPPCSPEQHWSLPENKNPFIWNYMTRVQL